MNIANVTKQIKYNCDISDAKYWGYFSLCGLLLRLRELYKSEHNISPWSNINQKDIGEWINAKETLWAEIEEDTLKDLDINGAILNPLEVSKINSSLIKENLIYGSGLALYKKPVFFLGELYSCSKIGDYQIYLINKEYARDLFTSSGMLQGKEIFIRLEQLKSLLWEMFLELKCKKNSFSENIFSGIGITAENDINTEFEIKLENLALRYSEIVLNHELAEAYEATDEWTNIIYQIEDRKAEYFLRGLKDMLADTSEHGPLKKVIDMEDKGGFGFYISLTEMFHKAVHPELKEVFCTFAFNGDWGVLEDARIKIYSKSILLKEKICKAFRKSEKSEDFLKAIRDLV